MADEAEEQLAEEAPAETPSEPVAENPPPPQTEEKLAPEEEKAELVEPPAKDKSEPLIIDVPSEEQDLNNADRGLSPDEAVQVADSTDIKGVDEETASRKKSKQDSISRSRTSAARDDKKPTKSITSLGDRRISVARTDGLSEQDDEVNLNLGVIPETILVSTKPIEGNVLKYVADYVETRKSRLRNALGSIIDIRRSSVAGEVYDRKIVRYMNTYKLESDNPFNPQKVDKILESVMMEALENLTYDPEKCPKQAKWASLAIRSRVKALEFDRYKIICIVTIGEKHSQDVLVTCRFLWDAEKDRYSTFSMENTYVFGIAQCFGLYYE